MGQEINATPSVKVIEPGKIKSLLMPGEVGATLELTVRDKNGKITEHRGPMRSNSFVRQFLELLWIQTLQIPETVLYQVRDTGNALQDICESGYTFACNAGIGVVTHGVVVGTGNAAPTINDFVMGTLITHGVAAGQLQYSAVAFGAPASDATTSRFTITRDFANGSGGLITVNEIGLYTEAYLYNNIRYFMTIRDVIGGGLAVPNGQTLTVNYQPQAAI